MSLTSAEAAEQTGLTAHTLRYYEREGLIGPIDRTAGGRRTYRQEHLDWLDLVKCLRDTGMPISDLKRYTALSEDASTLGERLELLEAHDREVQASIDRLIEQQNHLREKIAWYRGQVGDA